MEAIFAKPQLRLLLDHLGSIRDTRQSWKVAYPLREVLFLVVCGTIASADDYEEIVDWGEANLSFLRDFGEFHHGIPCADWLRTIMNRIDPALFRACFSDWVAACWPQAPDLVAIDGKTSRRSHDHRHAQKALHLVSAFATNTRLVLGQEAVFEKSNEITAIPALIERLDLEGALVSIDAMGCNPDIAANILDAKADYLLAVKDNQPTLHAEIRSYFDTAPAAQIERHNTLDKDHGRLEQRRYTVSRPSTGSPRTAHTPEHPGSRKSSPSRWSKAKSKEVTKSRPSDGPISPRATSRPRPSPPQCAAIGPSRTISTGHSMSPSARINQGYAPATAPKTWLWSDTSLSISSETSPTRCQSSGVENAPPETTNTCSKSSDP